MQLSSLISFFCDHSLKFIVSLALLAQPFSALPQERTEIKGYVKDTDGNPIAGVSIVRKASQKGITTDEKGFFTIRVGEGNITLVFSSVGFATKEVRTAGQTILNVVLEKAVVNQEEVVIIGYGTAKRKDLTGSVSSYKPKGTEATQFNTVDALLRGRAAGVNIQQNSSAPGGTLSVKIRGANSLRGDNEPLYVVDGIIIGNTTSDAGDPQSQGSNSSATAQSVLSGINPQDIESIEVLKDASATAIYGSRGANGVVIITTKQGKTGKPVIQFSTNIEYAKATRQLNMLDAVGYAKYMNEIEALAGRSPIYGTDTVQNANWQNVLQRPGITQTHRISLTGASNDQHTKYYLAGGYKNVNGIIKNSGYTQGDLKLNLSQDITNKLKLGFSFSGQYSVFNMTQNAEPLGGGDNSFISKMLSASPIANAQTDVNDPIEPFENPNTWLLDYDDIAIEKRLLSAMNLTYKINSSLSYKLNIAADYRNKERKRWFGKKTFVGKNANGSLGISQFNREYYLIENLLMWNKSFTNKHRFDGTFGVTYDNENVTAGNSLNTDFFSEALRTEGFGYGQKLYPFLRNRTAVEIFSVLGRINYTMFNRYIFTLSGRADGSSKFSAENKFSYYPAAAFAWKLGDEKWFKVKGIDNAKIRLGYGQSGNQAITPYNTFSRYVSIGYSSGNTPVVGVVPQNIQNPNLKWETTEQYNAGIDLELFNKRISFTADAYHKETWDLLQVFSIPTSTGFSTIPNNIGRIQNQGLEFTLNSNIIDKSDLTLSAGGNISFNRNKILDLGLPVGVFGTNNWEAFIGKNVSAGTYFKDPANIFIVGKPLGMFYGYQTEGIYQTGDQIPAGKQAGDIKVIDQNKDGLINASDKVIIGNPNPKFNYGFNTELRYKKITASLFFNGLYGNQIVNGNLIRIANPNGANGSNILSSAYYDAWTPTNPSNNPRVGSNNLDFVDRYVENGSFLRMSIATIGYTFSFGKESAISQININVTGRNLFTITKYTGFDPEVNSFEFDAGRVGVDWNSYPNTRAFTLGLNLTF